MSVPLVRAPARLLAPRSRLPLSTTSPGLALIGWRQERGAGALVHSRPAGTYHVVAPMSFDEIALPPHGTSMASGNYAIAPGQCLPG
jgi:hypothetical protein